MAFLGSASYNLSPILFKGNNRALGVNVIIHQDESGSMNDLIQFYSNGTFIGTLQDALLAEKIGDDILRYPNLYSYFGVYSRNPSTTFTISNSNGILSVNQAFMKGEETGSATISKWTGTNYFTNSTTHVVNICTDVIGNTTGGRLFGFGNEVGGGSPKSEDVHGNIWSIFTTPNAISTGIPGRYGSVISSNARKGSTTIVITNSDEQDSAPSDMTNQLVDVQTSIRYNNTGLDAKRYSGYFGTSRSYETNLPNDFDSSGDNVNYTFSRSSVEGPLYVTEFNRFYLGTGAPVNNMTWNIEGYFLAPTTGSYTFFLNSDDASYLWIGAAGGSLATSYTKTSALVNNGGLHPPTERFGTISLTAGNYYPIRVIYGNQDRAKNINGTELTISFSGPGISKRIDGRGYFFNREISSLERTISQEINFRNYRIIALSSYNSTDGYDGVLFYGTSSTQPYGYVTFTSNTNYTITRSTNAPSTWVRSSSQLHDTLILASNTRGGLFKIRNIFTNTGNDRRVAFSNCLAEFIADTV